MTPNDGDHYAGRPDPIDEAIAATSRPTEWQQANTVIPLPSTGRYMIIGIPVDIGPVELLEAVDGLMHYAQGLGDARAKRAASRIIVPGKT